MAVKLCRSANSRFIRLAVPSQVLRSISNITSKGKGLVLGCGSNVVDHIYYVKAMPKVGDKGFFKSPFRSMEMKLLGGVTLNHLSWAALGGVPTGLLALQGEDETGIFLRKGLQRLAVSEEFLRVDKSYKTGECHVFIQQDGERTIIMGKGATSLMDSATVNREFKSVIADKAAIVSTEISQMPLSGVLALLKAARETQVLSVLDLDVTPSVCIDQAELGTFEELLECVNMCDILKPAKAAAVELLKKTDSSFSDNGASIELVAARMKKLFDAKLVAITDGSRPSVLANKDHVVAVAPPNVLDTVDATGAGDAFLGGVIAGLYAKGLPQTVEDLQWLGEVANGFGATCVQYVGGVPADGARKTLTQYLGPLFELPSVTVERFRESLCKDLKAASELTEELSDLDMKSFLDCLISTCSEGQIFTSGVGKSGHVAARLSSSLSSLGIPSQFVHAAEWGHGDLGKVVAEKDAVLFLSNSGNTPECVTAASILLSRGVHIFAMTGGQDSELAKMCTASLVHGCQRSRELFGAVPTSSIIVQEMLSNALLYGLAASRGIQSGDGFRHNHPGGAIGATPL